MDTGQADMGN